MLQYFRINIIVRIVLLLLLALGIAASIEYGFFLTAIFLLVLLAITVVSLFRYVNQTNRDLAQFFDSVKYNDFITNTSSVKKGESFERLHEGFNLINKKFRDIRAEKEANHQFLQTLVKHVDIGLLGVDENGEVILMNQALQTLLHKSYLINLDGLKKINIRLWEIVKDLKPGRRELLKVKIRNELLQLSIQAVEITMQKELFRLITFQNIQTELEAQELMAWQKLIRILTHEIMNSVAPISSLSSTINDMLQNGQPDHIYPMDQIKRSIAVIKKRSEGLLEFTETYRTLTRIPPPKFQIINAFELIHEVATLMSPDLDKKSIQLQTNFRSEELLFEGDPQLLEQVLINLFKNAIDALADTETPSIMVSAYHTANGRIFMEISDNGPGIPEEELEQIFVPFYTTKAHGSGIGLSLSRQIMRMHKGTVEIQSEVGEGTKVILKI